MSLIVEGERKVVSGWSPFVRLQGNKHEEEPLTTVERELYHATDRCQRIISDAVQKLSPSKNPIFKTVFSGAYKMVPVPTAVE